MNTVLYLLMIQGLVGAFDTLWHHELSQALARRPSARIELRLHSVRAMFYGFLFAALAWSRWQGGWAGVLAAVVLLEVVLTLYDFVEEDRSRQLPASERVVHTLLAINGGALFALLAGQDWWSLPTAIVFVDYGWISVALSLMAVGVTVSGIRDGLASLALNTALPEPTSDGTPRRWLITGGSGFIAQTLLPQLLAEGHVVTVLSRRPRAVAFIHAGRVRVVASLDELSAADQFDVVLNLAGEALASRPWTRARREQLLSSRVDLSARLVAWLQQQPNRPEVLISASGVGFYGTSADRIFCEADRPGSDFPAQLCDAWEQATRPAETLGMRRVSLRLALVLGRHGGVWPALSLPVVLGTGGRIGGGRQWLPWVHIDDVVAVIRRAASDAHWSGALNVVAPQKLQQRQFVAILARLRCRPLLLHSPAWIWRLLLGTRATLLLDGQRVEPARLTELGYVFRHPGLESAAPSLWNGH